MAPLFEHYGVQIARARIRTRAAMTVQARDQGRYLGGRPPYGYRLVDAGPHPNRALARRGVHMQRLDVDPQCGPVVSWISCPAPPAGPAPTPDRPGQGHRTSLYRQ